MAARDPDDQSSAHSLKQLAADIATLVRSEVEMAKHEMMDKAKSAGLGAGMLSASAVGAIFCIALLTVLAVVALAIALPLWLAVLIVALVWAAATVVLALLGKKKVQDAGPFVPEQTIQHVKEEVEWARGANPLRK